VSSKPGEWHRGINCGKKRVERIMRTAGITAIQKHKYKVTTTDSKHKPPVAENKLDLYFHCLMKRNLIKM